MDEKLVFCDLETTGLEFTQPIIQIAAIAVDAELNALEAFEVKIQFDEAEADPKSLRKNNYSKQLWARRGVAPLEAAHEFSRFLRRHATVDMLSANGKPYRVAQLVAHNAERFDAPFLHAWYERLGVYLPARYMPLCTKQRALWLFDEDKTLTPPASFQLGTLCQYFGVSLPAENAHDAFYDVRATVELYRQMRHRTDRRKQQAA